MAAARWWCSIIGKCFYSATAWSTVRVVAELQALTRASYAMLVVVPVLCATWPAVRFVFNNYNNLLRETTTRLGETARDLRLISKEAKTAAEEGTAPCEWGRLAAEPTQTSGGTAGRIEALAISIEKDIAEVRVQGSLSPFLPASWALAFFAALAVTIGHTMYQACVPDIVRRQNREEFVRSQVLDYRETSRPQLLTAGIETVEEGDHPKGGALEVARRKLCDAVTRMKQTRTFAEAPWTDDKGAHLLDQKQREKLASDSEFDVVASYARLTYERESRLKPYCAICALLFYVVGLALLLQIVARQSWVVAESAGWVSYRV